MKKLFFVFMCFLCMVSSVHAVDYFDIKEIEEISKYNPTDMFIDENGVFTFYGDEYECDLEINCNLYSYDFKGNVKKLNNWSGYGDIAFDEQYLKIKEKVDNYYTIQTCYRAASDIDDKSCKVLEDLKVKKLILTGNGTFVNDVYVQFNIIELYNNDNNETQIGVFDSLGNELIKPSSEYEILNEYESYSEESYPEAKFITHDNLIILKNKTTEKYHLLADNGVAEIMSLDVLKEYGLDEKNITNLDISLLDEKNFYTIDDKIFGDINGVFSNKKYNSAYVTKLGEEYVIVDHSQYFIYNNVYKLDGTAVIKEDEYRFINKDAMDLGLLFMYDKSGEVELRNINYSILGAELNLDPDYIGETELYGESIIGPNDEIYFIGYQYENDELVGNKMFVLTKVDEYSYKILSGEKTDFKIDASNFVTFKIDGDFKLFKEIYIDGKLLDSKNYTVKEGSTIITLNNDYARKLADGKEHTIKVMYTNDKEVSTTFKVEEMIENPHTGYAISVLFVGGLLGLALFIKNKRNSDVLKKI